MTTSCPYKNKTWRQSCTIIDRRHTESPSSSLAFIHGRRRLIAPAHPRSASQPSKELRSSDATAAAAAAESIASVALRGDIDLRPGSALCAHRRWRRPCSPRWPITHRRRSGRPRNA